MQGIVGKRNSEIQVAEVNDQHQGVRAYCVGGIWAKQCLQWPDSCIPLMLAIES